jgi:hypothetical protein
MAPSTIADQHAERFFGRPRPRNGFCVVVAKPATLTTADAPISAANWKRLAQGNPAKRRTERSEGLPCANPFRKMILPSVGSKSFALGSRCP